MEVKKTESANTLKEAKRLWKELDATAGMFKSTQTNKGGEK
jgi:hypothetical protein